jgi:lipopolysaccharide heptosyltransferase I
MSLQPLKISETFIESFRVRSVLIIKLTSLGDVIHTLPVASALKRSFPFLKLHWVVEDRCASLLENHPDLDSVVVYPRQEIQSLMARRKWGQALGKLRALRSSLANLHIDLSLDLQGLAKSGLMAWFAKAPHRIGCSGLKEFSHLVSRSLPGGEDLHAVDRNLQVAAYLGARTFSPEFVLGLRDEERRWADDFLKSSGISHTGRLAGLHLGASLPQKCWPLSKFMTLVDTLAHASDYKIILLGDAGDKERIKPFQDRLSQGIVNALGKLSLRQLMALTACCRLFVGSDTGPLHLAAALGLPVIALCGPDDPKWTGPYGPGNRVHYKRFPCSPCNKSPVCEGRYDCMEAIEVEEVLASFQSVTSRLDRST